MICSTDWRPIVRYKKALDKIMLRYHSHLFPSRRHSLLSIIPYSSRRGGGRIRVPLRSLFTTKPPPPPPPSIPSKENPPRILTRLSRRLPKFLHPYTNRLVSAPLSHITSFLILHELSAVVPLVALFGLFHYTSWLPGEWLGETVWAKEKAEKLVRYLERKGYWKGRFQRKNKEKKDEEKEEEEGEEGGSEGNLSSNSGRIGERISRVLLELATSYAIVKVLLPVRIILSVWATPWFARNFIIPLNTIGKRFLSSKPVLPARRV